jgi:hypothetical protein
MFGEHQLQCAFACPTACLPIMLTPHTLPAAACLPAETDPSHLLGQFGPNEGGEDGSKVAWFDGPVTRAFISGSWVVLDDLGLAEGQVQERLNPLLERPPVWLLAEKGDSQPLVQGSGFQLVATMTPPRRWGCDQLLGQSHAAFRMRMPTQYSLPMLDGCS